MNKNCKCIKCTCTEQNHCGCMSREGCQCDENHVDTKCNVLKNNPTESSNGPRILIDPLDPLQITKPHLPIKPVIPKGDGYFPGYGEKPEG